MSEFHDKARTAEAAMRDVFPVTPLQRNVHLSERFGADIWLKREDLGPVRSYKLRGAYNAMRQQPENGAGRAEEQPGQGVLHAAGHDESFYGRDDSAENNECAQNKG